MATQKFRPVLTHAQISHIITLCQSDSAQSIEGEDIELNQSVLKVLVPMLAKISVGAITPSYSISPESERKKIDLEMRARYNDGLMSPEEESRYESKILGV